MVSYQVLAVSQPAVLVSLFLLYILLWSIWGYKEHYSFYWTPASEFAKTVELGENETMEDAVLSIKIIKFASVLLIALLVSPLFYVYLKAVLSSN